MIRLRHSSLVVLALASLAGVAMFAWPLFTRHAHGVAHNADAPMLFVLFLPVLLGVVLIELTNGRMDPKTLALLGVLSALGAALRPISAGTAGIELMLFLLILGGRAFGPGFGFVLGATTLFASALLTGGVGPWLPFQMMASAWIGLGAGLLPRQVRHKPEIAMLAAYGAVAAYFFGFAMNLWFWPFAIGGDTQLSFLPGAAVVTNLHRFVLFTLATSSAGWDTGRAIANVAALVVVGPAILAILRRASRRAAFDAPVTFSAVEGAAEQR